MKTITNVTRKPLRIRLPRGKTLFLGPNQRAQIRNEAIDHPPVKKLIEAKELEVFDGSLQKHGTGTAFGLSSGGQAHGGGRGKAQSGDR